MSESPEDLARLVRVLEVRLHRSEEHRAKLEEQRDFNDALHRRIIDNMSQAELRLRESEQRAQAASTAKSEFLANMSHEIRTPLTAVIGIAELLRATPLDARQQELFDNLVRAARLLGRLIDDVLDFSRIEAGGLQLEEGEFDPIGTIREALDVVAERAAGKGLALVFEPTPPVTCRGDAFRLRQVFINLLGNAVKFTERGEIRVRARLATSGHGFDFVVTVSDTGIGIPEEQLEAIFSAFRQADNSTTRRYGGTGLGLSISRKIVEEMGGTLTAARRGGGGSVFTVSLPGAQLLRRDAEPEPGRPVEVARPMPDMRGCRILVAEDNDVNRSVVASILSESGAIVSDVVDGEQALALVAERPFDLVFLDLHMPLRDGVDVARFASGRPLEPDARPPAPGLQSRNLTTPIVALTAAVLRADRERCLDAGMVGFVAKPFTRASLIEALERYCHRRIAEAVDRRRLAELQELVPSDALHNAVDRFVETVTANVAEIVARAWQGDLEGVASLAHNCKSSAGQLGATELGLRLEAIELAARAESLPSREDLNACMQAAFDAVDELPRALSERAGP